MPLTTKAKIARALTLFGYFGLFILLTAWILWLSPTDDSLRAMKYAFFIVPMLFPLRGLLHARPYTHAWMSFLALGYFTFGIGEWFALQGNHIIGLLQVILSLCWFTGSMLYARYGARVAKTNGDKSATP